MAAGIPFSGQLTTTSPTDTYAVTDSNLGKGGVHLVASVSARNAITTERRNEGMLAYTQDTDQYWSLGSSPWNGTSSDWTLLSFGTGFTAPVTEQYFDFTNQADWVCNHSLGGQPDVSVLDSNGQALISNYEYPGMSTTQVIVHHGAPESGRVWLRK